MNPPNVNNILHNINGFRGTHLAQKFLKAVGERVERGRDFIATRGHAQQASAQTPHAPKV